MALTVTAKRSSGEYAGRHRAVPPRRAMALTPLDRVKLVPSWVWHLLIAVGALVLRLVRLGWPNSLVFDEAYYVKQAWSMYLTGVELRVDESLGDKASDIFASGTPGVFTRAGDLVVHPPLGKWLIAAGEAALGVTNPVSWRIAAVLAGAATVYVLARLVTRLLGPWWGALAAALLAFESTSFVVSRTGILDVFVGLFALMAIWFVVIDRDWTRQKLLAVVEPGLYGPFLWHPWRWAAGASLGLMTATKWSGLYLTAVLGLLVVLVDMLDRRKVGVIRWHVGSLLPGAWAFVQLVVLNAAIYLASWVGWFVSDLGYARNWSQENPATGWTKVLPDSLRSWLQYQKEIFDLSVFMDSSHPYQTKPWSWMLQDRPTLFFQRQTPAGVNDCPAGIEKCYETITSLGTVPLWWLGLVAMLCCLSVAIAWGKMGRWSWPALVAFAGMAGMYLPWFTAGDRTIYSFYTGAFAAEMIICVVVFLAMVGGRREDSRRRDFSFWLSVALLLVTIAWFAWFYPVLSAQMLTESAWELRMDWWPHWR